MKTFIPSEEELVELWFMKSMSLSFAKEGSKFTGEYYFFPKDDLGIHYSVHSKWFFLSTYHKCEECWKETEPREWFYPRDKAHLESIILAFKKP